MFFRTSELKVQRHFGDSIERNWNRTVLEYTNHELVDDVNRFELVLRVPYVVKGSINHMRVPSRVAITKHKTFVSLSLLCDFRKPMFVSVILGAVSACLFLVLYSTLLFSLLFALFVTVSCFGVFYVKIGVSSRRFLIDLTQKQLENDGTSPDSRAY